MKKLTLLSLSFAALAASSQAAVIAQYDTFTVSSGATVSTDASSGTSWTTSSLIDQATGTGALGNGNQTTTNRQVRGTAGDRLSLSNAREADSGTPTGTIGESTWFTFSVTADASFAMDFTGQTASADTFADRSISSSNGANYNLYFSLDGGSNWTQVGGTQVGASTSGTTLTGPVQVVFDLSAIGQQTGTVDFLFDPVSTGAGNGTEAQRSIQFDNLVVNANIAAVPEPASTSLLGLAGMAMLLRRRR